MMYHSARDRCTCAPARNTCLVITSRNRKQDFLPSAVYGTGASRFIGKSKNPLNLVTFKQGMQINTRELYIHVISTGLQIDQEGEKATSCKQNGTNLYHTTEPRPSGMQKCVVLWCGRAFSIEGTHEGPKLLMSSSQVASQL